VSLSDEGVWEATPKYRLHRSLVLLNWSPDALARALRAEEMLVSRWASGALDAPSCILDWLEAQAMVHLRMPPPDDWSAAYNNVVAVFAPLEWKAVGGDSAAADVHLRMLDSIRRARFEADLGSERLVDAADVDEDGVYRPERDRN
jgi:hypothetical protein